MARYSKFLGRSVVVQYRAGDMILPASGTFVADSGRSIFLEQQFEQRGQHKHFRWEIPYQCVVRLEEKEASTGVSEHSKPVPAEASSHPIEEVQCATAAAGASGGSGSPGLMPISPRPKIA